MMIPQFVNPESFDNTERQSREAEDKSSSSLMPHSHITSAH